MKTKLTGLLLIIGGLIAVFLRPSIPVIIVSLLGGFSLGFGLMLYTSVYSGNVWGVKIKRPAYATCFLLIGQVGLIIGGFGVVYCGLLALMSFLQFNLIELLVNVIVFFVSLAIGPIIAKKVLENTMARSTHAMVLGEIELFKEIDGNLNEATTFVVGFEGVALYSSTNYCYAVYLYENYCLGALTKASEGALVGSYFVQKYSDRFTYKVDEEIIPGTPGQTVVAVGTGGVSVGRISGTADKRLFRSYIFTKK